MLYERKLRKAPKCWGMYEGSEKNSIKEMFLYMTDKVDGQEDTIFAVTYNDVLLEGKQEKTENSEEEEEDRAG